MAAMVATLLWVGGALASPEQDRLEIIVFFGNRFGNLPLDQYALGSLMVNPDARAQYDSIMEFPPFQADIDRGRTLWETPFRNGSHFSDCFPDRGRNVAGNYPYYDERLGKVVTFEMALNRCRGQNGEQEFAYENRSTMGVLTAYARTLSDGMRMDIRVDSPGALEKYEEGKTFYYRRIGQMNLACASCHITHAGHYFRDEIISPTLGQATHFPVFRAGEYLYTLQMRYQRCMEAVRAVPFPAGSEELNNLEYFHSYLSNGLPLKASVYRK